MQRTRRIDLGTAVNVTFKLMRLMLVHELENGRLSARQLRRLASEIEERSLDSRDPRDAISAELLREVVEATIRNLEGRKRLPAR